MMLLLLKIEGNHFMIEKQDLIDGINSHFDELRLEPYTPSDRVVKSDIKIGPTLNCGAFKRKFELTELLDIILSVFPYDLSKFIFNNDLPNEGDHQIISSQAFHDLIGDDKDYTVRDTCGILSCIYNGELYLVANGKLVGQKRDVKSLKVIDIEDFEIEVIDYDERDWKVEGHGIFIVSY